jgi:hypothetical protein
MTNLQLPEQTHWDILPGKHNTEKSTGRSTHIPFVQTLALSDSLQNKRINNPLPDTHLSLSLPTWFIGYLNPHYTRYISNAALPYLTLFTHFSQTPCTISSRFLQRKLKGLNEQGESNYN